MFWNKSFEIKVLKKRLTEVVPVTGQRGRSTAVSTALEHTNHNLILAQIGYKKNEHPNLGISLNT